MKAATTFGSFLLATSTLIVGPIAAAEDPAPHRDGQHTWIDRPWDIRYFLKVEDAHHWAAAQKRATERNGRAGRIFYDVDEILETTTVVRATPSDTFGPQDFAVMAVEFDSNGMVKSGTKQGGLRGRLNRLQYLVLAMGDEPDARTYNLAHWFTGLGDASVHWSPAFCLGSQKPDAAMVRSATYLYGSLFKADEFSTTFGCREWAFQLYDPARPYVDVTSYLPQDSSSTRQGFIRPFIGWARAGDRKPIIGKHGASWYCLRDCPGDASPGLIPDIAEWAKANGWRTPKPPTKVPTFPDPPATSGTYPP